MVVTSGGEVQAGINLHCDRTSDLKAFDDTKAGVKGLVDAGDTEIPRIFIQPPDDLNEAPSDTLFRGLPVIDFEGVDEDPIRRKKVMDEVHSASETWGFFQVVNDGIPTSVLEEMLDGVRKFHEQDAEVKKALYTRDLRGKVGYLSTYYLYSPFPASWRDSLVCIMDPRPANPEYLPVAYWIERQIPNVCRDILIEYSKQVERLASSLCECLTSKLKCLDMDCAEELPDVCLYYPACPQPGLTVGTRKHSDADFLTVLPQDQLGGLQVLHQNQWVDVPPIPGALVINTGDLLRAWYSQPRHLLFFFTKKGRDATSSYQPISSKASSTEYWQTIYVGPRVSAACFFRPSIRPAKVYGPIKELLPEENPPKFKETALNYVAYYNSKGLDGTPNPLPFKL